MYNRPPGRGVILDRGFFDILLDYREGEKLTEEVRSSFTHPLWDHDSHSWSVRATRFNAASLLPFAEKHSLPLGEGVREKCAEITEDPGVPIPYSMAKVLRPFQREGVEWMITHLDEDEGVILADEIGTGKTLQSIAVVETMADPRYPRALIVCPANIKHNWKNEIEKWTGKEAFILNGRKNETLPETEYLIVNYDILVANLELLRSDYYQFLICDEAHRLANPQAAWTKAATSLTGIIPYRILITGTPINNRVSDLWSQLVICGRDFCSKAAFFNRYCGPVEQVIQVRGKPVMKTIYRGAPGGNESEKRLEELHQRIKPFFIRRLKEDVLKDVKEPLFSVLPIEIGNEAQYKKQEGEFKQFVAENAAALRGANLGETVKPGSVQAQYVGHISKLRRLVAEGKVPVAISLIEDFLASGEKLVAFAHHRLLQEAIYRHFGAPVAVKIAGGDSAENRDAAVKAFQCDPQCRLIVCSLRGAREGLDGLQHAASNCHLVELDWTATGNDQAIGRVNRFGQKKLVSVRAYVARGTVDERVARIVDAKRKTANVVTGDNRDLHRLLIAQLLEEAKYETR